MPCRIFIPATSACLFSAALVAFPIAAHSQNTSCPVNHNQLVQALKQSVKASGGPDNGGLPNNEWTAVVNRQGVVCAVAFSGNKPTDQWLGSRAIAMEKANTVNAFSLDNFALSTANLWAQAQPGSGPLFGAAISNPPIASELYAGNPDQWGSASDPLVGKLVGGVIAFGGGLALYQNDELIGGLGASGNTSCADHNIAWRVREKLGFGKVPNGPTALHNDAIVYDVVKGKSQSGWGHPACGHKAPQIANQIGAGIVVSQVEEPTGSKDIEGGQPVPPPQDQEHRSSSDNNKTLPGFQR
jgi:uncharacterized protein GlcG (DUF336 family)